MEQKEDQLSPNTSPVANQQTDIQTPVPFFKKYKLVALIVFLLCIIGITGGIYVGIHFVSSKQNQLSTQTGVSNNNQSISAKGAKIERQLLSITGSPQNTNALPLGDNKYTTSGPKKGYIYLCNVQQGQGGALHIGSWVHGSTWSLTEKPQVNGNITWSQASFSLSISGSNRIISGNNLPVQTLTGIFPIASTDPAYQYDRNPNTITAHTFTLSLPVSPTVSSSPTCMGGEVGIMLNGVPLFNGFDADHRDAAAHEVQDSCAGHPQSSGEYHYHSLSRCIKNIDVTTVIGYALDGFPITGPVLSNGNYLTTNDLDECHGLTSEIVLDGKKTTMYHYVMTEDFPYSVSCFRGKPQRMQVIPGQQEQGGQIGAQNGTTPQPPQAAFTVCAGKNSGSSCSFTAPRGTVMGTCQLPPNQSSMVCVPTNSEQNQNRPLSQ